MQQKLVKQLV